MVRTHFVTSKLARISHALLRNAKKSKAGDWAMGNITSATIVGSSLVRGVPVPTCS